MYTQSNKTLLQHLGLLAKTNVVTCDSEAHTYLQSFREARNSLQAFLGEFS
jgi:hypothetical protein